MGFLRRQASAPSLTVGDTVRLFLFEAGAFGTMLEEEHGRRRPSYRLPVVVVRIGTVLHADSTTGLETVVCVLTCP